MLTSYLTDVNWRGLSASYGLDDEVELINNPIVIDGNLNTVYAPILSGSMDFIKNNYSFLSITRKNKLTNFVKFNSPTDNTKNVFGLISLSSNYLSFSKQTNVPAGTLTFTQLMSSRTDPFNNLYFFELQFKDNQETYIKHLHERNQYYLAVNPVSLELLFVAASGFNSASDYLRSFNYTYNPGEHTLTLQYNLDGVEYAVLRSSTLQKLILSAVNVKAFPYSTGTFFVSAFTPPASILNSVDWGSYVKTLNQNNIDLNIPNSYLNIENNHLVNNQFSDITSDGIRTNILTLKNQLNTINLQGRGNIFLDELPVQYRNYVSLNGGGRQEKGYDKLELTYDVYLAPYTFNQGKTTWFHTPQNMYPFERININDTKLIQAGAIAGDHPLRSDKVFKKIANYKSTSNQGNASTEQSGRWLCAWLSGAPDINIKPVWVDRYYNPSLTTPLQAIGALYEQTTEFDNRGLPPGITDVPSELTFEPGCWYAYSHIGKSDALQNVKALEQNLKAYNFDNYLRSDGSVLEPSQEDYTTYKFDGKTYATIDVSNFNLNQNIFSMSFWAKKDDWSEPCGYELAGNLANYGFGIFNYELVTPFCYYVQEGNIILLNYDLDKVSTIQTKLPSLGTDIEYIFRRKPLDSFHVITNTQQLVEFDLNGTIVDAASGFQRTNSIKNVSNDNETGYVLYDDNRLRFVNLNSNIINPWFRDITIGDPGNIQEVRKLFTGEIAFIGGTQSILRGNDVFFLSGGTIRKYSTETKTITSYLGTTPTNFVCYNIDKYNYVWACSGSEIKVYGPYQELIHSISLTDPTFDSVSSVPVTIKNITFLEGIKGGNIISSALVTASGQKAGEGILYRINYSGVVEKTITIPNLTIRSNYDPTNHSFNYAYTKRTDPGNVYTFRIKLYNQFNSEDVITPEVIVNPSDLGTGWHHFAINFNSNQGILQLYIDGTLYKTTTFTGGKYNFIPLLQDTVFVGTTPFYSGLPLFEILDKSTTNKQSYFMKDIDVQNFYFYDKELSYFDISMLYKQKFAPKDLVFDIPTGRRNYSDVITRYFQQRVPGAKSGLYNVYINNNVLDNNCRDLLTVAITNSLPQITPSYSKLNAIRWVSNLPTLSTQYYEPFITSNTLTQGGVDE